MAKSSSVFEEKKIRTGSQIGFTTRQNLSSHATQIFNKSFWNYKKRYENIKEGVVQ